MTWKKRTEKRNNISLPSSQHRIQKMAPLWPKKPISDYKTHNIGYKKWSLEAYDLKIQYDTTKFTLLEPCQWSYNMKPVASYYLYIFGLMWSS